MSGCASVVTDPNTIGGAAAASAAQIKPLSSQTMSAEMPNFQLNSIAMYPTVIGWAVLYTIVALCLMFLGAFMAGSVAIMDWWSTFIWSTLIILLVILSTINGSYNSMLVNMHMCANAQISFIQVSMSILSLITILLWYIMYYDFGTNQNVNTYLFIMLHVNLLCSLLNLCLVVMQNLSNVNISKSLDIKLKS